MSEVAKLRIRLKNVSKGTTEYKMTVIEARALLDEIDKIASEQVVVKEVIIKEVVSRPEIWDGGNF